VSYPLNVTIVDNGNINSTSITPPGQTTFSCNTTGACSPVNYLSGTVVILSALPSTDYAFSASGWSGCDSVSPDNQCTVTIRPINNVTATFTYVKPVRVILSDGITPLNADGYDTLTAAYGFAPTGSTIQARVHTFTEPPLTLNNGTDVVSREAIMKHLPHRTAIPL
jgi:hypothetical protein